MKKCSHCGQLVAEHLDVCPNCGSDLNRRDSEIEESGTIGILAIVFGAFGGFLGFIFGIIGIINCKKKENRRNSIIGICLFLTWVVLAVLFFTVILGAIVDRL